MPAVKKNIFRKKKKSLLDLTSSDMDKNWPPAWSVSFSDMTTLLMTVFILIYSLTAKKVPQEFLALKDGQRITPEMIEYLKDMEKAKVDMEKVLLLVKDMTPQQESALAEIKKTAALENELKNYLSSKKIEEEVTIEAGMNAAIITPRAPLLFSEGEVWLKPEGVEIVDKIAQLIKELPYYEISIAGHTDPKPIDPFHRYKFDSNWELSYGRAIAIAKRFIAKGVPPQRLSVAGYAQYKPRYPNDTKENRAKNRRVEIYISFSKETNNKKI